MEAPPNKPKNDRELAFRQFLANTLNLFALACLCYTAISLGSMWFHAWQNTLYPFNPQRGIHPPWMGNPVFERGLDHAFKSTILAFAAAVIAGVLITNWRAIILIGCTIASGVIVIYHSLSLLID